MRNACRKDESRGGIRQCANMLCGRWEAYPREFAKCRRCRKAKYCGKECQSTAWSEGHRFWCSAKEDDDSGGGAGGATSASAGPSSETDGSAGAGGSARERRERRERERRERERERAGTVRAVQQQQQQQQQEAGMGPVYPDARQRLVVPPPPPPPTRGGSNATLRPAERAAYVQTQTQDPIGTPARARVTQQQVGFAPMGYDGFAVATAADSAGSGSGVGVVGAGRRRAETVTGASMVSGGGGGGGGPSVVHHLHGPGYHGRGAQGQGQGQRTNPLMQFVQPRGEAGPSRWRGEEGEDGDGDDMVLG
ncbi:MYND-type zinc finger protein samB [Termitomyces sp. J132]|nr:MYND-type zinc finger protein samB [Termitomyces sp. J132]